MTHDELLSKIKREENYLKTQMHDGNAIGGFVVTSALRAVVELHKPVSDNSCSDAGCCGGPYPDLCEICSEHYPCETIEAIEKELQ